MEHATVARSAVVQSQDVTLFLARCASALLGAHGQLVVEVNTIRCGVVTRTVIRDNVNVTAILVVGGVFDYVDAVQVAGRARCFVV